MNVLERMKVTLSALYLSICVECYYYNIWDMEYVNELTFKQVCQAFFQNICHTKYAPTAYN